MLTVTTVGGEIVFGPHQLQHPFWITGNEILTLLKGTEFSKGATLLHGVKSLARDDIVVGEAADEAISITLVKDDFCPMPEYCSSEAAAMIEKGVLVELVSEEFVFRTEDRIPKDDPLSMVSAATLPSESEYWAVQAIRKTYLPQGCDDLDFAIAPLGTIDVQEATFWFLVDENANNVGWILPGRANPRHRCYVGREAPEAVFALTPNGKKRDAEQQFLAHIGWKHVFEERTIDDLDDMNFKDVRSLLQKHGVAKNHSDRCCFLADARAAMKYRTAHSL